MGAYAVAFRSVLSESVQDVSSNSKYERTMKGAVTMGIKVWQLNTFCFLSKDISDICAQTEKETRTDLNDII